VRFVVARPLSFLPVHCFPHLLFLSRFPLILARLLLSMQQSEHKLLLPAQFFPDLYVSGGILQLSKPWLPLSQHYQFLSQ
jgi:hypothetical protein